MLKRLWSRAEAFAGFLRARIDRFRPVRARSSAAEIDFLPAVEELVERPVSPLGRAILAAILILIVAAVVWAFLGKLDVHASLSGRIVPAGRVKVVEPLERNTVRAIRVREGEPVAAGQVLIELDPTEPAADHARLRRELAATRVEVRRLRAAIGAVRNGRRFEELESPLRERPGTPAGDAPGREAVPVESHLLAVHTELLHRTLAAYWGEDEALASERRQSEAELTRLRAALEERRELNRVVARRAGMFEALYLRDLESEARYLQAVGERNRERLALRSDEEQVQVVQERVAILRARRRTLRESALRDLTREFSDAERRRDALVQERAKALRRERHTRIAAPVAGTVRQLAVHTEGEVVEAGQRLLVVVPEDAGLEVEAWTLNKDRGFVSPGQPVRVKVESFPFTRYGAVEGEVLDVANDAVEREGAGLVFPVRVSLASDRLWVDGRDQPLVPGMAVRVEVRTGERRTIEYLLTPLLRYRDEALRER